MKLIKYSQFTFIVEGPEGTRVLIDPGKYNYSNGFRPSDFGSVDLLIITHKHGDHHDEAAESDILAANPDCRRVTNTELMQTEFCSNNGFESAAVGDVLEHREFKIVLTYTDHFAKGESVVNFGMFIEAGGRKFYHTSDTRFMEQEVFDLDLVRGADVLTLPISNRGVVMGIDDAVVFTAMVQPKTVIPAHYDAPKDNGRVFPEDFQSRFATLSERISGLENTSVKIMNFGDELTL